MAIIGSWCGFFYPFILNQWLSNEDIWRLEPYGLLSSLDIILSNSGILIWLEFILGTDRHLSRIVSSERSEMSIVLSWRWRGVNLFWELQGGLSNHSRPNSRFSYRLSLVWVVVTHTWIPVVNICLFHTNCEAFGSCSH